jgi:hypothetical protein
LELAAVAIYRCEVKAISRGGGRSCVAAAAYRHAAEIRDERQDMTHDYRNKSGVAHSEIIAPADAPEWVRDRACLWNALDAAEKRRDAITAREVLVALPRELTPAQRIDLVRNFVRTEFTARGIIADVAIHAPDARDGGEQPHAHIMLADRALDASTASGLSTKKDRTLAQADGITAMRAAWAGAVNRHLERAQVAARVDHRSLEAQRADALARGDEIEAARLDRTPEPKIGSVALAMEKQGRGHQSHALRDAMAVRQQRTWRERLVQTWREAVAEVRELRQGVEAEARQLVDKGRAALEAAAEALMPMLAAAGQQMQLREAERLMAERQRQAAERQRQEQERQRQREGRSPRPGGRGGRGG